MSTINFDTLTSSGGYVFHVLIFLFRTLDSGTRTVIGLQSFNSSLVVSFSISEGFHMNIGNLFDFIVVVLCLYSFIRYNNYVVLHHIINLCKFLGGLIDFYS